MGRERLLVIDADLPKRLAPTLGSRNRNAISAAALGLADNIKDPELLRGLAENYNGVREWVLVTGDDGMPAEHGEVIGETCATIATIHPDHPEDMTQHACESTWFIGGLTPEEQTPQTVRRYSLSGSHIWTPRRRQTRQIGLRGWTPWTPILPGPSAVAEGEAQPVNPRQDRLPGFS